MTWRRRALLLLVCAVPITAAAALIQAAEPLPHGWLNPSNPHYWANLLRSFTFLLGGVILGMVIYTMARSVAAEAAVSGDHPRTKLYYYVTVIACSHALLMVTLMFYVRDRINEPLSPATPVALTGLVGTVVALALMLGYQGSRLRLRTTRRFLGVVDADPHRPGYFTVKPAGVAAEGVLDDLDGELVRLTLERLDERN